MGRSHELGVAGIDCDITVGNSTGIFKSMALKHVAAIDDRFPNLVRLVKAWAQAHDLNDAHMRTFNSFALTLMVRPSPTTPRMQEYEN